MTDSNKHNTGQNGLSRYARRLLAYSLPVFDLNCNDAVPTEVMRAADGCMSAFQALFRVLLMRYAEVSTNEEKSQALHQTRNEVFKQMNVSGISPELAECYRNYLSQLDRVIEAHDGGWRERMFPMLSEPDDESDALKNLAQDQSISLSCNEHGCISKGECTEITIAKLVEIKGGDAQLTKLKFRCSACNSRNVQAIVPYQVYSGDDGRG